MTRRHMWAAICEECGHVWWSPREEQADRWAEDHADVRMHHVRVVQLA